MVTQDSAAVLQKKQLHFSNFNRNTPPDNNIEVFNAYLEFAYHHTLNDAEIYENARTISRLPEQKNLFIQLACRKSDVADRLRLYMSDSAIAHFTKRTPAGHALVKKIKDTESFTFPTMDDAVTFASQRESRTTAFYKKLSKTANLAAVRAMFDFLLESQRRHLLYITQYCMEIK